MSWASKRQSIIISGAVALALIPVLIVTYKILSKPATCFDKIQNQNEVGVDCGGPCSLLCRSQVVNPIISWKRLFAVGDGVYNAIAYIENPNTSAGAQNVSYRFRVFNEDGISVYERHGVTVIPAKRSVPIIETGIALGDQKPSRIEFTIDNNIVWKKESAKDIPLNISQINMTGATSTPSLSANIENTDVVPYKNIEVVAILYDVSGNAIGASRTFLDSIDKGGNVQVIFTWPNPFSVAPSRIEIVPKLFI